MSQAVSGGRQVVDSGPAVPVEYSSQRPETQCGQKPITHGNLEDFYGGIDKRIGTVSLDFYEQMRKEHCSFVGCDVEFKPQNYDITTTPRKEWLLITEGEGAEDASCESVKSRDIPPREVRRRVPARWWKDPTDKIEHRVESDLLKTRSKDVLEGILREYKEKEINLLMEELVAIILFTGPMYTVYNAILSDFPKNIANAFIGHNKFATTIHAIMSAIQKLSLLSPVEKILFRGLGGWGHLPDCFWEQKPGEKLNVHGYTEFGVMSFSSKLDVALKYSGVLGDPKEKPHPAVIAFFAGAVDRGADVLNVSQFPQEIEFTFPPLSYIQPEFADGKLKIYEAEHPEKKGVKVPVIHVRVNANVRTPTLDQVISARKKNHITAFRSQNHDTAAEIQELCESKKQALLCRLREKRNSEHLDRHLMLQNYPHSTHSVDADTVMFEGFQWVIVQQCEAILKFHDDLEERAFVDKLKHARLVQDMISVRKWAVAKLLWFIEDKSQDLGHILSYPLQKSYREYVSFCRSEIRRDPATKNERALSLCLLIGLLVSNEDGSTFESACGDESPIVAAVENGASSKDIELMLDTGLFPIDCVTLSGNSILSTAVRFGFTEVATLLLDRGANVNFVNEGRTPMMFAVIHGHSDCVKLLKERGATEQTTPLSLRPRKSGNFLTFGNFLTPALEPSAVSGVSEEQRKLFNNAMHLLVLIESLLNISCRFPHPFHSATKPWHSFRVPWPPTSNSRIRVI
jgi:hypothetical protein